MKRCLSRRKEKLTSQIDAAQLSLGRRLLFLSFFSLFSFFALAQQRATGKVSVGDSAQPLKENLGIAELGLPAEFWKTLKSKGLIRENFQHMLRLVS